MKEKKTNKSTFEKENHKFYRWSQKENNIW